MFNKFKMFDGFHAVHRESLLMEKETGREAMFKGTTQVIYRFPNGHGASVIKGDVISWGLHELYAIKFPEYPHNRYPRTKRLRKKYGLGEFLGDPKRYDDLEDLEKRLNDIKNGVFQ